VRGRHVAPRHQGLPAHILPVERVGGVGRLALHLKGRRERDVGERRLTRDAVLEDARLEGHEVDGLDAEGLGRLSPLELRGEVGAVLEAKAHHLLLARPLGERHRPAAVDVERELLRVGDERDAVAAPAEARVDRAGHLVVRRHSETAAVLAPVDQVEGAQLLEGLAHHVLGQRGNLRHAGPLGSGGGGGAVLDDTVLVGTKGDGVDAVLLRKLPSCQIALADVIDEQWLAVAKHLGDRAFALRIERKRPRRVGEALQHAAARKLRFIGGRLVAIDHLELPLLVGPVDGVRGARHVAAHLQPRLKRVACQRHSTLAGVYCTLGLDVFLQVDRTTPIGVELIEQGLQLIPRERGARRVHLDLHEPLKVDFTATVFVHFIELAELVLHDGRGGTGREDSAAVQRRLLTT
jgi:hypothetical protein